MTRRYGWLIGVLFLVGCGTQATATPTPVPATLPPTATQGPSPTPTATATVTPTPTDTPVPSATPGVGLLHGGGFSNWMAPGSIAFYTLEAETGDAVRVTVTPEEAALDLRLSVIAPGEYEIARIDLGGPGEPETLAEVQLPLSGLYQVAVGAAAGEGVMHGELAFLPPETLTGGGAFTSFEDAPFDARIDAPGVYHVYTFDAPASQVAMVQAIAADPDLDLYFHTFQPDGTILGRFDDELPPNNPALHDRLLPQAGRYMVLVGAKGGTGAYQMVLAAGG